MNGDKEGEVVYINVFFKKFDFEWKKMRKIIDRELRQENGKTF